MDYELYTKLYDLIYDKFEEYTADNFYFTHNDIKNVTEVLIETLEKNDLINKTCKECNCEENKENEITLKSLVGAHIFTGVERGTIKVDKNFSWDQDKDTIRFELDGQVYEAVENPSDGYRSYMDKLILSNKKVRNKIPEIQVVCVYRDDNDCDLLDFIDCKNGKVFLTVGTKHVGDYYPVCIFEYHPENLSINENGGFNF